MSDILILIVLLLMTYFIGSIIEKKHFKNIRKREINLFKFPYISFSKKAVSAKRPIKNVELVSGCVVVSGDYFKKFISDIRNFFGGRMVAYESIMDRARREALLRMRESAIGADIIVNTKIEAVMLNNLGNSKEQIPQVAVYAYGTAITYDKQ